MVLVTGATGILGRVIVLELLKQGKEVRATKRPSSNLKEVRASYRFYTDQPDFYFDKIQWMDVDFEDLDSLREALIDIDQVYHCAAIVSFNPQDDKAMNKTNVDGTRNLLYAVENSTVEKFLFVSSIAVLDGYNEQGMMDENSDFNPKLNHSGYAISKHLSEMEVWRASAEGLNTVIINPGLIIGSGNWKKSSGDLISKSSHSYTFPGGTAYVDVRDVARIAIELMARNTFGERFIISSENYKYQKISDQVRQAEGLRRARIIAPFFLDLAPIIGTLLGWLVPGLKLLNRSNVEAVKSDSRISNKKITDVLGYHFIPVAESIDFHLKNYLSDRK
ncbi:NAD-dependent epimerase/dehydratase family protein [Epilithonimonas vandammei]|uniref:NAD-dependent epimerase/dehydratase family protein n=1 Tax=Epilithonimonas vandammei TaxID=2487072 RepID=UPI0028AC803D|nr:NAD-dependent epimerase/dehydratase family protein [Epilithonimonas vandammei]